MRGHSVIYHTTTAVIKKNTSGFPLPALWLSWVYLKEWMLPIQWSGNVVNSVLIYAKAQTRGKRPAPCNSSSRARHWRNNRRNDRPGGPQEGPTVAETFQLTKKCVFWTQLASISSPTPIRIFCSTPSDGNCVDCSVTFKFIEPKIGAYRERKKLSDFFFRHA